jgi:hypothetical protein
MGNAEIISKEDFKKNIFEESKREYFFHIRKNLNENIKQIVTTLNTSSKNNYNETINISELSNDNEWQTFLLSNSNSYKSKMNQTSLIHFENFIDYVKNLKESNQSHIYKLKLYLSQEIDENKNKYYFSSLRIEDKKSLVSPLRNKIIQRSINFMFENIEKVDHPFNKVIKNLSFNLFLKYENELFSLDKTENMIVDYSINQNESEISRSLSYTSEKRKTKEISKEKFSIIKMEELDKFYNYCKEEILNMTFILIISLIKFYNIAEEPEIKIIDVIGEKIKDLLVSGDLLRFLKKLKYNSKEHLISRYHEKFLEFYNIMPCDLSISPFFAFDEEFKTKINEKNNKNNDNFIIKDNNFSNLPFYQSLLYLREINNTDSIIEKVEIMFNLRNLILNEIDMFWKGFPFLKKKRIVDADNLLSIFVYLVIKSQMIELVVDIEIIDDFINKSLQLSRKGKI